MNNIFASEKLELSNSNANDDVNMEDSEKTFFDKKFSYLYNDTNEDDCYHTSIYSFGCNEMGQLGRYDLISNVTYSDVPIEINELSHKHIKACAIGDGHCLAVSSNGNTFSWGACACGQLGIEISQKPILDSEGYPVQPIPTIVSRLQHIKIKSIACGSAHTLALSSNGDVYSWGGSGCGQLGHSNISQFPKDLDNFPYLPFPKLIDSIKDITICDIACGKSHSVAIDNGGKVYTWGAGGSGQLGVNDLSLLPLDEGRYPYQPIPKAIESLKDNDIYITKVVCGEIHTLLLATTGELFVFGSGANGQLGLGPIENLPIDKDKCPFMPIPTQVTGGNIVNKRITYISCGSSHNIVIDSEGVLYGWGLCTYGQLGLGLEELATLDKDIEGNIYVHSPRTISKLNHIKAMKVSCGENHSLVLSEEGLLFGFGLNHLGQLGMKNNTAYNNLLHVNIPGYKNGAKYSPTLIKRTIPYNIIDLCSGGVNNLLLVQTPRNINHNLFKLLLKEELCDFTIQYGQHKLKCHKYILIRNCEYFDKQIHLNKNINSIEIEQSSEFDWIHLKCIIEYIYLNDFSFVNNASDTDINMYYTLAKKFNLSELQYNIKEILRQKLDKYMKVINEVNSYYISNENENDLPQNVFFKPDGTSYVITNSNIINDIESNSIIIKPSSLANDDVHIPKSNNNNNTAHLINNVITNQKPISLNNNNNKQSSSTFININTYIQSSNTNHQPQQLTSNDLIYLNIIDQSYTTATLNKIDKSLQYFNNISYHDIQITIDNNIFYANKVILAASSQFFYDLLTQNVKESMENKIEIEDLSVSEFLFVLLSFYCDNIVFNLDIMLNLLKSYDMFQVDLIIKDKLVSEIQKRITIDNVTKVYSYSKTYHFDKLNTVCLYIIKENFDAVIKSTKIEDLPKEYLIDIIRNCK